MDDLLKMPIRPVPTAQRPLLGVTILAVEDSRFASEALRLLCLRSGARLRRADCIASAERHLHTYLPDVAIVDLGLPDGSGLDLIKFLDESNNRPAVVLATSGVDRAAAEADAMAAGAQGFLSKPVESLAAFQQLLLELLPSNRRPVGVRVLASETVRPDLLALAEDLTHAARLIDDEGVPAAYIARFLQGLARSGRDEKLLEGATALRNGSDGARHQLKALIAERQQACPVI